MNLNYFRETESFKELVKAIHEGKQGLKLTGIVPAAKPFFLASLIAETKKRIVFIQPSFSNLSRFADQCRTYLFLFSSELRANFLPPLLDNPYETIPPSLDSVSTRMNFFHDLLYDPPDLVLTNPAALLWPFPRPENLRQFFLEIGKGEPLDRDGLLNRLKNSGYSRVSVVNAHGEFTWRGGIVDVFSPWQENPYRIEFSGDKVASLREFNLSSQRSLRKMERLTIPSLYEFPLFSSGFLSSWESVARSEGRHFLERDLDQLVSGLEEGEIPPSFYSLSLMASEQFQSFQYYLNEHVYILDDYEDVVQDWRETRQDYKEQYMEQKERNELVLPPGKMYSENHWNQIEKEALHLNALTTGASKKIFHFPFQSVIRFENKIPFFIEYLKNELKEGVQTSVYFSSDGVRRKLAGLLSQHSIPNHPVSDPFEHSVDGAVSLLLGNIAHGFSYPPFKWTLLSEKDIFTEERVLVSRSRVRPFVSQFRDLKSEDFVVHTDCGIGVFKGLIKMELDEKNREFIEIHYKDDDKLFVPVEDLNLVQKYSNVSSSSPPLNKLGTPNWEKTKERTKKVIETMAKELLHLYAKRRAIKGFEFSQSGTWQIEFDKTFQFEETEDQKKAIEGILQDMESESPMDRLICGDVGYGKTEVAIRAAFKAVMDSKQVAVLCPTTVLASQHLQTFKDRMILFPVKVESLTRLQTKTQQKRILGELKKGIIDIVIGTHRVLSSDIEFHDLGLLVVDEEQRFGVKHKEKLKQMRMNVDVLTMTATPIPRTLNLSLSGLKDISLIETPPKDRLAIHTVVTSFSRKLIASGIKTELARGGQVYFIHNRIADIDSIAQMIEKWVPEAKVAVIHGKISGLALEKKMIDFIQMKYNVLVSTTIIENGIDIPLVNTLFVNQADRFGLAQLYQLRGRVGRSSRQAVAYFLVPPFANLTLLAKERLKALKEFSALGSGFRLAARDLEIRGAGDFLGSQQHGYMAAVGFEYYMHLMEQTVKRLKGDGDEDVQSEINLKIDVQIPEEYLPQMNLRLNLYKRISSVESLEELDGIRDEIKDRFGSLPKSVKNLLRYGAVKFLSHKLKITSLDRAGHKIIFKFSPSFSGDLNRLKKLLEDYSGTVTPQGVLSLNIRAEDEAGFMIETITVLKELTLM
ncbi:transcription-repair coupling factor [Acidobacteriota bacterium]